MTHTTHVATVTAPDREDTYQAVCTCGWRGEALPRISTARGDGHTHEHLRRTT